MRGRRPTPSHLKLVRGNPGKRPVRMDEFRPEASLPPCPRHLKGEAKKEWLRLTKELAAYSMVANVDRGALAMVCTLWARYVHAEEMIETAAAASPGSHGLFVKSPNGFPIQSPWLSVSNKAIEQYKGWCSEFGLTPAARVRAVPMTSQASLPGFDDESATGTAAAASGGWSKFVPR